jgi:hypothetical protein
MISAGCSGRELAPGDTEVDGEDTEMSGEGDTEMSGDGDGDGDGDQPTEGAYSPCLEADACGGRPYLCLGLQDMGMTVDGFCSLPCVVDENCPPSPGGTAEPACIDIGGEGWCVLGCGGGDTCPGGMVCTDVGDGNGPYYCF